MKTLVKSIPPLAIIVIALFLVSCCDWEPGDYKVCVCETSYTVGSNTKWNTTTISTAWFASCPDGYIEMDEVYSTQKAAEAAAEEYITKGPGGSTGGGDGNNPICDGGYVQPMPSGYIQSNSYCQNAYYYICIAGYSPSSAEVKNLCETYKIWQTHDDLKDCKYCK